ncbi:response regulator transcription factor [Cohnella lupini]|uniref:Two-component system response regulator YesN n=1 Tax=Cohnella lupini TaxID=1294267 RepID=A0A3D9IQ16_9BACL|nr:response regulator [Cohnella lupini]RED63861.1 two-component system response regulator YesN [Cohnella lupini]
MIQLLLVDDEPMILNSMVDNAWTSVGVSGVYKAVSGLEAIEVLRKTPIDIVVTDIRMPGMDGLQLCRHIQEHYPRTKCILLSGYGEFEYARKAIQFGTANYLLKPIKDQDLLDEVERVIEVVAREWEHIGSVERTRQTLRVHLPLLRSNLLNDLLSGVAVSSSALEERMKDYELPFGIGVDCALLLVRLDGAFVHSEDHDYLLYEYGVQNIACEILDADFAVWQCKDSHGYLCFVVQDKNKERLSEDNTSGKSLEKAAYELQLKVAGFLKGQISVLIGGRGIFPADLAEQYRKSLNEFRKIPRSDHEFLILSDQPRTQSSSLLSLYTPPSFHQLLEAGRLEDARRKLKDVFEEMNSKKLDSEEHVMEVVYGLMNAFLYIAHLQGRTLLEISGWGTETLDDPRAFRRTDKVMEWAEGVLNRIDSGSVREFKDSRSQLIAKIQRFIETHIAEDVSLQRIADHVNLHPAYLSSLYKTEMKENISDFIVRYRMETAGVLLSSSEIKIYELAGRLGFQNPPYFSKLFKQYYGMTPQEYRDRHYS